MTFEYDYWEDMNRYVNLQECEDYAYDFDLLSLVAGHILVIDPAREIVSSPALVTMEDEIQKDFRGR
jgi:hypothetical protein